MMESRALRWVLGFSILAAACQQHRAAIEAIVFTRLKNIQILSDALNKR
jgi:hypothetical protein